MALQDSPAASPPTGLPELRRAAQHLPLEQKVRLLTGESIWRLHPLPELGLRAVAMSDGPVGVRGLGERPGETSALFPAPSALAATWDRELAFETGEAFAQEAREHGVDVVLAPQVNIQRTPVGGRHFECYSEDPLLTAEIGTEVVRGLQDRGVAACVKHYIANDSETDRTTATSRVGEQALREVYLAPFARAIDAGAWSVMAAYNQVDDGVESSPMTGHRHLLTELLKSELGFDGVVVSDWVATRSTVGSAVGGLDVVMPGPGGPWEERLVAAVRGGEVPEALIDDKVARILLLARRVGALGDEAGIATGHRDIAGLIRRCAAQATVVLRSEAATPVWDRPEPGSIALIGANAIRPHVLGGGSSAVTPPYVVTPAQGLADRYPQATLTVERGGDVRRYAPEVSNERLLSDGVAVRVRQLDAAGTEVTTTELRRWPGGLSGLPENVQTVELRLDVLLSEPGDHTLEVGTVGRHRVVIDGELVSESAVPAGVEVILDSSINNPVGVPAIVHVSEPRRVTITTTHHVTRAEGYGNLVRAAVRHRPPGPSDDQEIDSAVAAAREADLTVVVVGTNEEVESEGWDRTSLQLPGRQNELVERVLDADPEAVVVVNAGAPVVLPWLQRARTVLWWWFPGQEAGHALADVLSGRSEPAGRLPWTLPARESDVPVPHAIPDRGVVEYTDGIHVGYRGWLRNQAEPAAAFGHGLGWTSWSYDSIEAGRAPDGGASVTVQVTNRGARPGREVVQVYVEAPALSPHERPVRWLGGFGVVDLEPGASASVTIAVARRQLEVWDSLTQAWLLPEGAYRLRAGRSALDLLLDIAVQVGPSRNG